MAVWQPHHAVPLPQFSFFEGLVPFFIQSLKMGARALTPLFGNGAGALGLGKISVISTKIGKIYIVYMYEVSNARLIPIVYLTLFLEIIYKISLNNLYE